MHLNLSVTSFVHISVKYICNFEILDVRPECEEQNNRFMEWKGGETKALELLEIRMKHEEQVSLTLLKYILYQITRYQVDCDFH